jgi:hypothetical protein
MERERERERERVQFTIVSEPGWAHADTSPKLQPDIDTGSLFPSTNMTYVSSDTCSTLFNVHGYYSQGVETLICPFQQLDRGGQSKALRAPSAPCSIYVLDHAFGLWGCAAATWPHHTNDRRDYFVIGWSLWPALYSVSVLHKVRTPSLLPNHASVDLRHSYH